MIKIISLIFVILIFFVIETLYAFEIDRRRDQFNKQYGQLFVPLPYSIPGLGTGLLFVGNFLVYFGQMT